MSERNEAGVLIARALREEEEKQRRRILLLSSIPVVIGLVVLASVVVFVNRKMEEVTALDEAKLKLKEEIKELRADAADLFAQNEGKRLLLKQVESQLPEKARQETELINRGMEQVAGGNYEAASQTYQEALALDPENKLALTLQGEAYLRDDRNKEALVSFKRALKIDPSLAGAHYGKGLALFRMGRRNDGVAAIQQAFQLGPSFQARAYGDLEFLPVRDYMERKEGQASAVSSREKELIEEALALVRKGQLQGAIRFYDAVLEENPNNERVWNWRGYALFRQGDYTAAIASFDLAIEVDPDYAEAYYNRALALWRSGDARAAFASVDHAFDLQPDYEQRASQDPAYRTLRDARARLTGGNR